MGGGDRTRILLAALAVEALVCVGLGIAGALAAGGDRASPIDRAACRELVVELGLTDLALWSGPAYCRHPSQADLFTPFSDHPGALEHFPAGSLVQPPRPPVRPASGPGRNGRGGPR